MKTFIHDDFLLSNATARTLYHDYAQRLPIVDYHSHVNPADLAADSQFADMTALWIKPDQYKHRAMRSLGIEERLITGQASAREKFDCWAQAVPRTAGNPLFHWTALELKRYFGIDETLNSTSATHLWEECNKQLKRSSHSARQLLRGANMEYLCTSDQWLDDLSPHSTLASSGMTTRVVPSLRADEVLSVDSPGFKEWVFKLGSATNVAIDSLESFEHALRTRLSEFSAAGCTVSDHGIDIFAYRTVSKSEAAALFNDLLTGSMLGTDEVIDLRSYLLNFLGQEYCRHGWVMLLHVGAKRDTSSRLRMISGPRGGFAGIGGTTEIASLCRFLDDLDRGQQLPRTILFNLNPSDNEVFAAITGSFSEEGLAGKVQFGPAWWFNDQDIGIRAHLDTLSRCGLLWNFIGMTTDSRSMLSMCRFEYFRRIFCDWLGCQVESGIFPSDRALLSEYVGRVCYENARDWFSRPIVSASKGTRHE